MTYDETPAAVSSRSALAAGLLLLSGLAACTTDSSAESDAPAPDPAPTHLTMPAAEGDADVPIEPGTYRVPSSAWSAADFTVTFPEGWTVQYGHVFHQNDAGGETAEFYAIDLDEVFTDACRGEGVPQAVGPEVHDLVTALLAQDNSGATGAVPTSLGGHPGTRVDLTVPDGLDLRRCRLADDGVLGLQLWYSEAAEKYFVLQPRSRTSIYILDVDGTRQVFLTQQHSPTPEARAEVQAVLDSIRIG
jgi:hypothetical protein